MTKHLSLRNRLASRMGRPRGGWLLIVVALLALPDCNFGGPTPSPPVLTTAIFCDIEKPVFGRHCASEQEKTLGIRLAEAAVALNAGNTSTIGLDESPDARARCGGEPEAVLFQGAFPSGYSTCQEPGADPIAACVTQCEHFFGQVQPDGTLIPDNPPDPVVVAFCQQRAHPSVNVPAAGFADACTPNGILLQNFPDPRPTPEPVEWDPASLIKVTPFGNTLVRTENTSPPADNPPLDAGAASTQIFTRGDGYVEFSATAPGLTQVGGLSMFLGGTDTEPSLSDLSFAIALNHDNRFYVIESGDIKNGPCPNGSFGTYSPGQRFRVNVKDHSDGTAGIIYSRVTGSNEEPCGQQSLSCEHPPWCDFHAHTGSVVNFPLRVDASFRERNSTLSNVTIVRIR